MLCENPDCDHAKMIVLESRPGKDQRSQRRRYECPECLSRYTSIERIVRRPAYLQARTPNS
jgi:transcriptional regulator NrdR family protein